MLPALTLDDPSTAANGTLFGGAFSSITIEELGGVTFIVLDRDIQLQDGVARTTAGAALTQDHALGICVGQINNVVCWLRSGDMQPGSAQRHVPALKIPKGSTLFFKGVQLAGAQEVARWTLYFA